MFAYISTQKHEHEWNKINYFILQYLPIKCLIMPAVNIEEWVVNLDLIIIFFILGVADFHNNDTDWV